MNTLERIGKAIKILRVKRGLSQEQLCAQCGVDQHYISNIENGQRNVSVDVVERIAAFFGLSLSEFFVMVETLPECHRSSVVASEPKVSMSMPTRVVSEFRYIKWMRKQGLSEGTIKAYSSRTVNQLEVQEIICRIAGTRNMYNVTSRLLLNRVIEEIKKSEFNVNVHSIYSAGVQKWRDYLDAEAHLVR